jgi:hypothetical protein
MKYILYTLSVLFVIVLFGCEGNTDPNDNNVSQDVIFPLAINNEWTYQDTYFDTTGKIKRIENRSFAIIKDSMRLGEKVFISNDGGVAANRADGFWSLNDGVNNDEQILKFKYPCKVGETYPGSYHNSAAGEPDVATITVESINEIVTVPAGSYTCIKYVSEAYFPTLGYKTDRRIYYIAPKVGIIKAELYDYINHQSNPYLAWRSELTRVTLK